MLELLPAGVPVLCTTATANDRVVADIVDQLGDDLEVIRGPLDRESLALSVLDLPDQAARLAWLAERHPQAARLRRSSTASPIGRHRAGGGWLRITGHRRRRLQRATATPRTASVIEEALLANEVKVVVATSALGMGFDKPDLGFVIHYQSPGSPIAYYQQVGRAGRARRPTPPASCCAGREDARHPGLLHPHRLPAQGAGRAGRRAAGGARPSR